MLRSRYLTDYYLISFTGSFSGKYLEVEITELVMLLTTLLESYFTCVQKNEFLPLHFEVDGQTIITPIVKSYGVPEAYDFSVSFKDFIANEAIWNIADLSGSIIIETVTSEIAVNVGEGIASSVWESSHTLLEAGSEVTSEIVTVGSEVGTEVLTGVAEATAGIFELLLEFLVELLAGLLI